MTDSLITLEVLKPLHFPTAFKILGSNPFKIHSIVGTTSEVLAGMDRGLIAGLYVDLTLKNEYFKMLKSGR